MACGRGFKSRQLHQYLNPNSSELGFSCLIARVAWCCCDLVHSFADLALGTKTMKLPTLSKLLLVPKFQKTCYRIALVLFFSILVIGSLPHAREDIGEYAPGIVLHAVAYAVLALLIFVGSGGNGSKRAVKSTLTVAVMGALDEYVQSFFPYRTAALTDWMIDAIAGGAVSVLLWKLWSGLPND